MIGDDETKSTSERLLRTFHEHEITAPIDQIAALVHPEAEMRLLVSFGLLLEGRAAVVEALERGREASIYLAQVERFEWLDGQTALVFGRARYALEDGGHAQGNVCWLDELRDDLLWRVQAFRSENDARRAYEERFEERLAGGGGSTST